MFDISKSEEQI